MNSHIMIISTCIAVSLCCRCRYVPPKEAYCNAEWVALAKVIKSSVDENEDSLVQRQYTVKYSETYKKPPGSNSLPKKIYTSTQSASCGVVLDTGKEYLLSGTYDEGKLRISSCGQIAADENLFGVVMEKKDITEKFLKEIRDYNC